MATDHFNKRFLDTVQESIGGVFAVTTQNFTELNAKRGRQWYLTEKFSIAANGGTKDFYFTTGDSPAILKYRSISCNVVNLDYEVYVLPTVSSPGTPITIHNSNGIYQAPFLSNVYTDPVVTTTGTLNERDWIAGAEGVGNRAIGAFASNGFEKIIPPNIRILTRFRNNGGFSGQVLYLLVVYEGPVVPLGDQDAHNPYSVDDPNFYYPSNFT